ncbi:Rad17 cell cycle checkpoint protein-domain-containing protein [Tricharina praecox]|uniref:Rad17 cell cycle checkpoint protein-domain-containing protein n=1 Tax=Tricharina praecox TaxID=43433 RepID=UPI00221EC9A3|nr:Rad17 cell cycle checkpoint protein-domain-containing protein [Tricharina praecox]KAI5857724.1 Rad17 cell cycle checkpoint protein-domain-containing protein [Tricharina praecox]
MPARPPAQKKRRTIVDSSDESQPAPAPAPASAPRETRASKPRAATRRSTTTTTDTASTTTTTDTAAAAKPQPAKTKPAKVTPPPRNPVKPKAKKLTGQYKSLHRFFGVPQGGGFPAATPAAPDASSRQYTPTASQHEDADDLIEDISEDDEVVLVPTRRRTGTKDGSLEKHLVVSKPGVTKGFGHLLGIKAPPTKQEARTTTAAGVIKADRHKAATTAPGLLPPEDTRTWPERFAPTSVEGLALNRTKVKEVRMWLDSVFEGGNRQRVCVFRGSAGTGKTATLNALAKEMGIEILEWRNPSSGARGEEYGEDGAFSAGLSGLFEEFVGRAGTFGCLDLISSSGKPVSTQSSQPSAGDDRKKKLILIEDFPNTLFTSSPAPLQSFRHTIKSFLALPPPPAEAPPIPPLILIITETASITGPNSFTAHRLLSPEILLNPLVKEIAFNKIAPTFMYRALTAIIARESRLSGRKFGPSKAVLSTLSTSGDIRSAVMGLEFLAMNGDLPGMGFTMPLTQARKRKKTEEQPLDDDERKILEAVTQRESSFGIFHAVGKIVYDKRYGDDLGDPYVPQQPRPPLLTLPYHPRAPRINFETFIDDTGTDPQTFIAGIHENFLLSCNPRGLSCLPTSDEDVLDTAIACLDYLSDSDLLASKGFGYDNEFSDIRSDEISFHTAVRGIMLSLPSPVKRFIEPKVSAQKMYYPTATRLWRDRQDVGDVVDWYVGKQRAMAPCSGGKREALEERMPFQALIERKRHYGPRGGSFLRQSPDPATSKALERVTVFKGVRQSDEPMEAEEAAEAEQPRGGRWKRKEKKTVTWAEDLMGPELAEKLVLSDDDIEEF